MSPEGVAAIAVYGMVCLGVGWLLGRLHTLSSHSQDLLETYKHLLEYGRPNKPVATVTEPKPEPEQRALAEIHETAKLRLTDHLAREAGVSKDKARAEAERLLAQFETYGVPPA